MDQNIAFFFWDLHGSTLYDIFNIISGKTYIILTCLPFAIAGFIKYKKRFLFFVLTALVAFSASDLLCYRVIKPAIKRPRPVYDLNLTEQKPADTGKLYSMPSNHASNITAFMIVYFFLVRKCWALLLLNSILISASRVITVNHYLTDVIAGIAVGLLVGLFAVHIALSIQEKYFYTDG